MKTVNKVRLIYLPAIVLPILVMIVSIAALGVGYMRMNDADISAGAFERFVNPLNTMNNQTKEIYKEVEKNAMLHPEIFEDEAYLKALNQRLKKKDSYLMIRKNQKIVYQGKAKVDSELIRKLEASGLWKSGQ